jgi:Glycosyl hydrolase family 47
MHDSGKKECSEVSYMPNEQVLSILLTHNHRDEAEDLFYHGYNSYMKHAFPEDELRPISCTPLTRDRENPSHAEINDVLGNYSLTLVDSLSTLAILASAPSSGRKNKHLLAFQDGVKDLVNQYGDGTDGPSGQGIRERGFNVDSKVQVFETVIRGLGGLLSAHLFAIRELPIRGYDAPVAAARFASKWDKGSAKSRESGIRWANGMLYDGQLLRLAYDLGNRLVPAFYTSTGIPYPRVNLRDGVPFYEKSPLNFDPESGQCDADQKGASEITETCSAGAGSLVLEFTVLSRLTGDDRFEDLAKRAFWAIWNRRSAIGLIGTGIDAENGTWIGSYSGIGAGVDSFFEYALKSHILLSNDFHPQHATPKHARDPRELFPPLTADETSPSSFLRVWSEAHAAVKRHLYRGKTYQHPHYIQGDLHTGATRAFWIDSLSSFYPGLLTLAGEVDEAIEIQLLTTALWTRFAALPERWNLGTGSIEGGLGWWGGRPEFIESNYHLYRATHDPWYLHVGEMALRDIKRRCWARCGWAGIQDVKTGELSDRMESFFLSETAKYLFLLFDEDHPLNHLDGPFVFNTEGHPLVIPPSVAPKRRRKSIRGARQLKEVGTCETCPRSPPSLPLSVSLTAARNDVFHAAVLARLHLLPRQESVGSFINEHAVDHPSISLQGVQSPSNYTYFPWTLPPELVPPHATSAPLMFRPSFDISFPALPNTGKPVAPLQRVREGILINHVGGLRLGMIQDVPIMLNEGSGEGYRINIVNNLALGKDEKVFLAHDTTSGVLNPTDPNFTRVRDIGMLDLVVDLHVTSDTTNHSGAVKMNDLMPQVPVSVTVKSALSSFMAQLSALLNDKHPNPLSLAAEADLGLENSRFYIPAITATGIGAAPIPDWKEAPSPTVLDNPKRALEWTSVYASGELCDHKVPLSIAKTHQVLLIKRGGCAFGTKLANIPAFAPAPGALQLVVVVSYEPPPYEGISEEEWLIRPLLDEQQKTSAGLVRRNPLPMVMVGGGERTYEALRRAAGVGVKRRYTMEAQGVSIANLIII